MRPDGRAPCPVCDIDPRTPGNARKRLHNHHGLMLHLRSDHAGWDAARMLLVWPAWFAQLRAACRACRNIEGARALRHEKKTPPGGGLEATPAPLEPAAPLAAVPTPILAVDIAGAAECAGLALIAADLLRGDAGAAR